LMSDASLNQLFKKKMSGVIGLVADLGKADPEHATALKIAAGNRMRNVAVENVDTAIKCLQQLKSSRAGIATLLPLDKIRAQADDIPQEILKKPGVVGLAHELITCESRYKTLFRYVFRNTLIVDDVNTAKSLGISKYRMVTLEGDMFEQSGAITGGFREKGGLGFEDTAAAGLSIKLESELSKISAEISSFQTERQEVEEKLLQVRTEKAELEGKVEFAKLAETDSFDFEAEEKKARSKISESEQQIKKLNKDISDFAAERAAVKARLHELQFGEQRQEVQGILDKKTELESQLATLKATLENAMLPEKENLAKVIRGLEKENKDFEQQQKEQEKKISQLEKELEEKEKEQTTFRGKVQELFAEQKDLSQQLRGAESERNNVTLKLSQCEQTKNGLAIERAQFDAELKTFEEEFVPFKDVEIIENVKSIEYAKNKIREFNNKLLSFGNVNLRALEVFDAIKTEYAELSGKVGTLDTEKKDVLSIIDEIEKKKTETFMKTYNEIAGHFAEIHSKIADKNHAVVELENPEKPFEGGVLVHVTDLKGKKAPMAGLSGGEKVLVALAFIFAIQSHNPAPFYLLDEIDAALDKVNSEKVAALLKEYSRAAQVIIISHNDSVISESDNVYGVSMSKTGESSIVSLKL
ncbi:MAG: AAA family ATPase, partial [archaeon]